MCHPKFSLDLKLIASQDVSLFSFYIIFLGYILALLEWNSNTKALENVQHKEKQNNQNFTKACLVRFKKKNFKKLHLFKSSSSRLVEKYNFLP